MNRDSYEPYEVALSNSQIVAGAALLVLVLVAAFAAGSWWGRSTADAGVEAGEAPQPASLLPPRSTEPESAETGSAAPAEVVRFFGERDGQAAGVAAGVVTGEPPPSAGLVVQVFSSADLAQAASVEQKLLGDGHPAFLSPQTLDGEVMQRVRVGPFVDQAAADAAAEQLSKQYGLETWITPNN